MSQDPDDEPEETTGEWEREEFDAAALTEEMTP